MNELKVTGKQNFMGIDIPVVLGGFGIDKKCVSDKIIAEIHDMEAKNVRARITGNIKRFKAGTDFIDLKKSAYEASTLDLLQSMGYSKQSITQAEHIYILSERGYAKLIKIMDSDLVWEIHDKLIDEYFQLREEKQKPKSYMDLLELELNVIKEVDQKVDSVNDDLQQFKRDMPLLALECQRITRAKNQKVVPLLGGKNAPAYKDKSLCGRVYRDLEGQLNREFGVNSYKAIKRNQCDLAIQIINNYELPMALEEEIRMSNSQVTMDLANN